MGRSTREEAEQTRLRIIDAAMRLFSRNGFANTSMENIASELGLTRGAIYGHFKNKLDLYEQLMDFSQEPLYNLMDRTLKASGSAIDSLRAFMLQWLGMLRSNSRYRLSFEILLNKTEFTEDLGDYLKSEYRLTKSMITGLTELIRRASEEGDLPETTDAGFHGLGVYCHLMGVTHTWLFHPRLFALKRMAEPMVDSYLQTLRSPTDTASV